MVMGKYNPLDLDIYSPKRVVKKDIDEAELKALIDFWMPVMGTMAKQYSRFAPDLYPDMISAGKIAIWNAMQAGWTNGGGFKFAIRKAMSSLCKKEYRQSLQAGKCRQRGLTAHYDQNCRMRQDHVETTTICRLDVQKYKKWTSMFPEKQREYIEKRCFGQEMKKKIVCHRQFITPKFRALEAMVPRDMRSGGIREICCPGYRKPSAKVSRPGPQGRASRT